MKRRVLLLVVAPLLLAAILYAVVAPRPRCVIGGNLRFRFLAPDGDRVFTVKALPPGAPVLTDGPVEEWDTRTGRRVGETPGVSPKQPYFLGYPGMRYQVAAEGNGKILIRDTETGRQFHSDPLRCGDMGEPDPLRFGLHFLNMQGDYVYAKGEKASAVVETATGRQLGWFRADANKSHPAPLLWRNAMLLTVRDASDKHQDLLLWDMEKAVTIRTWTNVADWSYTRDRRLLMVRQNDPQAKPDDCVFTVMDLRTLQELGRVALEVSSKSWYRFVDAPKGSMFAAVFNGDRPRVEFWDLATLRKTSQLPLDDAECEIRFIKGTSLVKIAGYSSTPWLSVCDHATGRELWRRRFDSRIATMHRPGGEGREAAVLVTRKIDSPTSTTTEAIWLSLETGKELRSEKWLNFVSQDATDKVMMLRSWPPRSRPTWWTRMMRTWWPWTLPEDSLECRLIDLDSGSEIARDHGSKCQSAGLSKDGRTWVTSHESRSGVTRLRVWDVPQATPWRWVLGPPLAWLAAASAWLAWRRRRKPAA